MTARLAALLVCLATAAAAQDPPEGVYLNRELQVRAAVPKGWTVRTKDFQDGWGPATLAEFASPDGGVRGALLHEEASQKVERYAEGAHRKLQERKGTRELRQVKEAKLQRAGGTWLQREYEADCEDNDYRRVHVFISRGKHNFHFVQSCPAARWEELQAAIRRNVDELRSGDEAFGLAEYAGGPLNVRFSYPASWTRRDKDFRFGDPNAVVEVHRGEEIFGTLGCIAYPEGTDLVAGAWADGSMKAFENSMENIRLIDARAVGACERRDFRADVGGTAIRFAILFWPNAEKRKGLYLYFWTAEGDWDACKESIERVLATFKTGVPEPAEK